jgi:3-oxoacyl-[acyl-carrier-protein] synthase-3
MYAGSEKLENGNLKGWKEFDPDQWLENSVFSIKQDVKMLDANIAQLGAKHLANTIKKKNFDINEITYFLPHLSSMYFKQKVNDVLIKNGWNISDDKWFTNLPDYGNIGSASIYIILDELFHSGKLKKGDKILAIVPESGRFSYAYAYLTVV